MSSAITFDRVSKTFPIRGDRNAVFTALDGFTLDVRPGELLSLVGPSGCGKSTLLDLVGGLTKPDSGVISIDGRPVDGPGLDRSIVFQQYALFPWRTALANVEFGLEATGVASRQRKAKAREFLELVGLGGFDDRYPHELSGGMKQRVAIARALAVDPAVLLMDEPFAALDALSRETLQAELVRIWQSTGKTIVFITHGIEEAVFLGQRVAVMTSRPGTVKAVVDVALGSRSDARDVRTSPEFTALRHGVWQLLRDEVRKAALLEIPGRISDLLDEHQEVVPVG